MELSVRFFKRLILLLLALMILVPTVLAIRFGLTSRSLAAENTLLEDQLDKIQRSLQMQLGGEPLPTVMPEFTPPPDQALAYQSLWPDLFHETGEDWGRSYQANTVYLTFDNAPSGHTAEILDALDHAGVKATFFVTGRNDTPENRAVLKEIVDRGHSIGILTYTYDFRTIYASVENYLEDFDRVYQMIYEATGVKTPLFRFPGGSVNSYNYKIYQQLIAEMFRRGFLFYDWNVSGMDNVRGTTAERVAQNVISDVQCFSRAIVELRDGGTGTAEAIPQIVAELQAAGYTFQPLTEAVQTIAFSYET